VELKIRREQKEKNEERRKEGNDGEMGGRREDERQ